MHKFNDEYLQGIKLYRGSKDCTRYQGVEASTNEASNQKIQWTNLQKRKIPNERYYDKILESDLNSMRKLPNVCA